VKPEGDLAAVLRSALRSDQAELSEQSLGLIGQWQVADLHDEVAALVDDNQSVGAIRLAAVRALGLLGGDDTKRLAKLIANESAELKLAALESLSRLSMSTAADHGARLLVGGEDVAGILAPFLNREGGGKALMAALAKRKLEAAPLAKLQSLGSSKMELMNFLSQTAGIENTVPAYSAEFVAALAKESTKGNTVNGRQTFQAAGCAVCHKTGPATNNGIPFIGPELDTIGNTLSTERIIEEVLWPGRHVKEGFSLIQVTTKLGEIHQGYEQRSRSKDIFLRPLSRVETIRIPHDQVREQTQVGSAMMPGLTAGLKRGQLRDLICFLAQQGHN